MPTDQPVLFKSRRQRLAEMLIMPMVVLPIGPALRALLGQQYDTFYAFAAIMIAILTMSRLSSRWAARHDGEWVTKAERLRRLVAESAEMPRWPMALAAAAAAGLSMLGVFLAIEPLDHLGDGLGGPYYAIDAVAVISVLGGVRTLLAFRAPVPPIVVDEPPPSGHFWTQLRAALPLTYAAYGLGAVAALAVAVQVQPAMRSTAFILTFLITSQLPLMLLRPKPKRIYPVALDAHLGHQVVAGILLFGIPMGIMFSAGMALDTIGRPVEMAILIAIVLPFCAVGGAAWGILMYAVCRFSEGRRPK
jgi:hypothetical protein